MFKFPEGTASKKEGSKEKYKHPILSSQVFAMATAK